MQYRILSDILEREGSEFYQLDHRWQPKNLLPDPYRRNLLKNAQGRLNRLEDATEELESLDRFPLYFKRLNRMRLQIKKAQFAWKYDDLAFLTSISDFFADYGVILQNLKIDQARGRLGT